MCGIAGLIHRGRTSDIGDEMTKMLQSLKHRGPDSTGYALYGESGGDGKYVLRFKVAEQEELRHGFKIRELVKERRAEVDHRLGELDAKIIEAVNATSYANKYV
ncbi:MAG TPA: glutamine amidotransferase, partial [Hyphomicrobium sp.]